MSEPYQPLWREMEEKYLESENLFWMCERPEEVLADVQRMIEALVEYQQDAWERSER